LSKNIQGLNEENIRFIIARAAFNPGARKKIQAMSTIMNVVTALPKLNEAASVLTLSAL
jgi:hypothetical protein